ncbi:hypothetical protein ERO13_D07G200400v2 [Gossypium hirsutum]|uniref:Uncharacterized protein n=4 Tax=Gossypium TaxID=3633 RepID=A0A0D2M1R0_GOSRA|nr:hypothetical protein ES319_D07G221000v1 [Gossypium barbadense]KAG4139546.1 hypothetical protein ERO13_D07G200400v2 [Gossypium hirsutum]KJB10797.1 hypothetical protein B456_001G225100 [Gossypium raimondii]TYG62506.1 hypothetical protein ES288_D07G237700v1 [Gossypium darwinii]TYI74758.1 hypothetical protein E1A91_D07G226300v1 [Gossypium mustelinum]
MKRSSYRNNNAVFFSVLVVSILLSIASSGSLLAEATIPNFSALQENLVSLNLARRNLKRDPPSTLRSPTQAERPGQHN